MGCSSRRPVEEPAANFEHLLGRSARSSLLLVAGRRSKARLPWLLRSGVANCAVGSVLAPPSEWEDVVSMLPSIAPESRQARLGL